ncbi:MAG TPA: GNAT family N-acetyltransferase [Dehalococcoidia bacterium]|jgi:ribosomal protein S18 acetylase RimI-like enzyme|nr:GNAT family N-acetyltransferase [Dehalococcoidia bacterium]
MSSNAPAVRKATEADVETFGRILGAAFDDDPIANWLVRQDERRSEAIGTMFREVGRYAYLPYDECYVTSGATGAALWRPPDVPEPQPPELGPVWAEVVDPLRPDNAVRLGPAMDEHHPTEEHFYLFAIGVLPEGQGSGTGSALMRAVLDRCDREGMPAYLENTNERNLPFYERHGFKTTERVHLPDSGPSFWPMWREPAG